MQVRDRMYLECRWSRKRATPEQSRAHRRLGVLLGSVMNEAAMKDVWMNLENRLHLMQGGPGFGHQLVGCFPLPAMQGSNCVGRRPDDFPTLYVSNLTGRELRIEFNADRLGQVIKLERVHADRSAVGDDLDREFLPHGLSVREVAIGYALSMPLAELGQHRQIPGEAGVDSQVK